MHTALICLLIFSTGQSYGYKLSSYGSGLKELFDNQKINMELEWKKEWNNITKENPYILNENRKSIDKKINLKNTVCYQQLNFQIMETNKNSLLASSRCRLEKLEAYNNFTNSIIYGFKTSSLFKSCYENKYLNHEILQCIDDSAMYTAKGLAQQSYQEIYNLLKRYNNLLSSDIKKCVDIFKASWNQLMNKSEIQFKKCEKINICDKIQLDINLINIHENYNELLYLMEAKSQRVIQRIQGEELKNYQNISNNNKNNEKNSSCCNKFLIKHIDVAIKNAFNQSQKCFYQKRSDFKLFISKFIENSETKKIFKACNNNDSSSSSSLELSLVCYDWVLKSNCTEAVESKYNLLSKSMKNYIEMLPSSIQSCLYKTINELRQFNLALKKEHLNCINNKYYNVICVDKLFKYDSNKMNIDSLNLYTNAIVTDIINAYK